jgi:hypothetical protein
LLTDRLGLEIAPRMPLYPHSPHFIRHGPILLRLQPAGHGAWDISLFVLAALAALGALTAIWIWIVQLRRTPEVRFDMSVQGVDWPTDSSDDVPILRVDNPISLLLLITNVGTGSADGAILNVVAPSFATIVGENPDGSKLINQSGSDPVVDNPPDDAVTWISKRIPEFYPSLPVMLSLGIEIGDVRQSFHDESHDYFVAISVEAVGFLAAGRRFIPSWVFRVPGERLKMIAWVTNRSWWPNRLHWGHDDFWGQKDFPGHRYRRSLRQVRALPRGHVRSGPGRRQHRRPFHVDKRGMPAPSRLPGIAAPSGDR